MARSKAQLDNLKKGKQFNAETARKAGKKGQPKAVAARKRNKTIYQMVQMVADAPISDEKTRDVVASIGIDDENLVNDAVVVAGIYNAAAQGNVAAVEKWEEMKERAATEGNDSAHEHALAIMRANFWNNVSSNFGQFNVCAIKHRYRHYEASGGRGSTKSSDISLLVVRLVMEHELVHALVMRKVGNTIADSVFTQYQWAIAQLGVAEYWKTRNSPPTLTYKPTGQRIMFRGADDSLKLKSIKTKFGYIGITHFEEKDQFAGRKEIDNILQSTMRGGDVFWNFESYNPPLSRDNWANKDSEEERSDRIQHHSTYLELDDPSWLGDAFIQEAEELKARDPRRYEHEYLGKPVGTGGNVFDNLNLREITDEEIKRFDRIYQGVDWGWFPDPFAFIRVHYDKARETIYVIDECYRQKFNNDSSANWIKEHGYNDTWITCDSAEPKSIADYRSLGLNARAAIKGPGSVDYGMKWLQKRTIVIDKRRTPAAYEEFVHYEYEKNKDGEWISGYPDANNHLIDALRYALERVFTKYRSNA